MVNKADMEKKPDEVSGMFDDVARGYDRTNDILSLGNAPLWRIATVRAIAPEPGERILDIAAGTGTSSAAIAKSGATVVALDFSPGMIAEGRRRHPKLEFVEGDAARLPFGDDEFDAVTISFGLRNIADAADSTGSGYPQLSGEYILAANPDLIVLADTRCCGQNAATVAARPGWGRITAVANRAIVRIDGSIASVGQVSEPVTLDIEGGRIVGATGREGERLLEVLEERNGNNVAELGIGTNEKAQVTGNILEDEKMLGTVHVAFGASASIGGVIQVPVHLDCVILRPELEVDGRVLVRDGELLV